MRMNIFRAATIALALFASSATMAKDGATVTVTPVSQDADAANDGFVYALPQTVLRVKLTAQVIVETAGPFYQYSTRHLNLTDVVTQNQMRWSLVAASVETYGVADLTKRYKVSVSGDAFPSLSLSADGALLSVNSSAPAVASEAPADAQPTVAYATFADVPLSQSVLSRTSKAAMAEDVAQSIFAIRAARLALLSGDKEAALPDAGAYALALKRLDNLESQHVELFAGRRDTITVVRYVDVTPDYNGANSVIPVRFSETAGFVDAMDLTGKPVYVDLEFSDAAKLNSLPAGSKQRKTPLSGLRHCVPGLVSVRVLDRNILLCQAQVRCSQNGQEAALPASLILSHKIVIDPATGALVSVEAMPKAASDAKK